MRRKKYGEIALPEPTPDCWRAHEEVCRKNGNRKLAEIAIRLAEAELCILSEDCVLLGDLAFDALVDPAIVPKIRIEIPSQIFTSNAEWRWLVFRNKSGKMLSSGTPWKCAMGLAIENVMLVSDDMKNLYAFYYFDGVMPLAQLRPKHWLTDMVLRKMRRSSRSLIGLV